MADRVGLWFAHGTRNVGDVALNAGLTALMASIDRRLDAAVIPRGAASGLTAARATLADSTELVVMERAAMSPEALIEYCLFPERLFRHYGLESIDTVLLHSGEHLYAPPALADLHPLALWRMLPALAAAATGRRVIQLPSTFGPFENRAYRRVVGRQFSLLDAVAARDSESAHRLASEFGVVVPALLDPAFFVRPPTERRWRAPGARVAISMRLEGYGLRAGTVASTERMAQAEESGFTSSTSLRAAVALGRELAEDAVLESITVVAQTSTDVALGEAIDRELRGTVRNDVEVRFVDAHESAPEQLQRLLAEHDLLITSRFHGSVLALAAGVPALAVPLETHGHKIPGLYELLGIPAWQHSTGFDDPAVRRQFLAHARSAPEWDEAMAGLGRLRSATSAWLEEALGAPAGRRVRQARTALQGLGDLARRAERH